MQPTLMVNGDMGKTGSRKYDTNKFKDKGYTAGSLGNQLDAFLQQP